jgi:site-specific DNA-cytosine methylase
MILDIPEIKEVESKYIIDELEALEVTEKSVDTYTPTDSTEYVDPYNKRNIDNNKSTTLRTNYSNGNMWVQIDIPEIKEVESKSDIKYNDNYAQWDISGKNHSSQDQRAFYKESKHGALTTGDKSKVLCDDYTEWNKASIIGRRIDDNGIRKDNDTSIPISQCLEVRNNNNEKMGCLTTVEKDNVLTPLGIGRHKDVYTRKLKYRKLHPIECERLQTVNDNYTEGVSNSQRYKMLGNGFTIDVIVHLINHILSDNVKYVDSLDEW